MTSHIDPKDIERHLRHSARLRSEAFGRMVGAIGRGLRHSARSFVAVLL